MLTDSMARIDKLIIDYGLVLSGNGNIKILNGQKLRKNADDSAFIRENRAGFLSRIAELETEAMKLLKQAKEEGTVVMFYSTGATGHTIEINPAGLIDAQLMLVAKLYPYDCSYESLRADYDRHIADITKKEVDRVNAEEKAKTAEAKRVADIKSAAVREHKKRVLERYTETVIVWAMPDGSVAEERKRDR